MPETPASAPETTQSTTPVAAPATAAPSTTPAPATAPSVSPAPAEPAASPAAKPLDVHSELMKVATAAVQKTRAGAPSAPTSQGNGKEPGAVPASPGAAPSGKEVTPADASLRGDGAKEPKPDGTAEEPPPFNDHPRWKKLQTDYQSALKDRDGFKAEVEELRTPAEQYGKITDFMDQFGITTDDMVAAYDLIARIKTDPISALERLTPIYQRLQAMAGQTLPDDLQRRVDEGLMDEDSAKELAQSRIRAQMADNAAKRSAEQVNTVAVNTVVERNRSAAANWESAVIARDPDYERKRPAVQDAARAILAQEGQPKTPEQAVSVLERAYKRVNDFIGGYAPRPNGSTPRQPSSASNGATQVAPQPPKSLAEAAMQGLAGSYRYTP